MIYAGDSEGAVPLVCEYLSNESALVVFVENKRYFDVYNATTGCDVASTEVPREKVDGHGTSNNEAMPLVGEALNVDV